jgi:hypothetical protein
MGPWNNRRVPRAHLTSSAGLNKLRRGVTYAMDGLGWFPNLRFYSPLESFFSRSWRPSEIERVGV